LAALASGNLNANNNAFSGGTYVYGGTLNVQNPFGLGGYNSGTAATNVSLYGGTLGLLSNAGVANDAITFGNPNSASGGLNVIFDANATINVDHASADTGNAIQIANLYMGNGILTVTGGDSYRLRVLGTTYLEGSAGVFNVNSAAPSGVLELAGTISDNGAGYALIRDSSGTGTLIVSGSSNSYSGGTAITVGTIQVTSIGGTSPLGSGAVVVDPSGTLRIADNTSLNGISGIQVYSSTTSLGMIALDNNFSPNTTVTAAFNSPFGGVIGLAVPVYSGTINEANANADLGLGTGAGQGNSVGVITSEFIGTIDAGHLWEQQLDHVAHGQRGHLSRRLGQHHHLRRRRQYLQRQRSADDRLGHAYAFVCRRRAGLWHRHGDHPQFEQLFGRHDHQQRQHVEH